MTRDTSVYLPTNETRCHPATHCMKASTCARALASIGAARVETRDPASCLAGPVIGYLSVGEARAKLLGTTKMAKPHLPW